MGVRYVFIKTHGSRMVRVKEKVDAELVPHVWGGSLHPQWTQSVKQWF